VGNFLSSFSGRPLLHDVPVGQCLLYCLQGVVNISRLKLILDSFAAGTVAVDNKVYKISW
jgi:hypothetical protein